jgi:hypothetical protein
MKQGIKSLANGRLNQSASFLRNEPVRAADPGQIRIGSGVDDLIYRHLEQIARLRGLCCHCLRSRVALRDLCRPVRSIPRLLHDILPGHSGIHLFGGLCAVWLCYARRARRGQVCNQPMTRPWAV